MTSDTLTRSAGLGTWLVHGLPARLVGLIRDHRSARVLVSLAMAAFAGLAAVAVTSEQLLLTVDGGVQQAVIGSRAGGIDAAMVAITSLGARYSIGALTFFLVLWSAVSGRGRPLVAVIVIAVLLNPIFEVTFKELVGRARPQAAQLVPGNGPSFPSGHVVASVGFYGMLPLLAWQTSTRAAARWFVLAGSAAVIMAVAVSRVYLDVHWTSDVVAGLLLGFVLVAMSYHAYLAIDSGRWAAPARLMDALSLNEPAAADEPGPL